MNSTDHDTEQAVEAITALADLERRLGLAFLDKSLLRRALTHRSYLNEHPGFPLEDNERLEFLGDAVLDFVTAEYLYHRFPEFAEGLLTNLRSFLVRRETLARFALQYRLGEYLLMGHGEAGSGGRWRPATLCATFEALVGAVYLYNQGLAIVHRFLLSLIDPELARSAEREMLRDAKSQLQEMAQGQLHHTPHYTTVAETGPDHAKEFTVQVTIGGVVSGQGKGSTKQQAAQEAARSALDRLEADGTQAPNVVPGSSPTLEDAPSCPKDS